MLGAPQATAELYDPATGTFNSTGSMAVKRESHTATLLSNGKVLVAGGFTGIGDPVSSFASAELYDPATGTFAATGDMTAGRFLHTATLLPTGKVLLIGGFASDDLASAELYDPATGTFAATSSMSQKRDSHSATLLQDGTVLVAGGQDLNGVLSTAELYDTATGSFSFTSNQLNVGRVGHTATLLPSGIVQLAGGVDDNDNILAIADRYDPARRKFTATILGNGVMLLARAAHTATLLSTGEVLIAGGVNDARVTMFSAELYVPPNDAFMFTGSMAGARDSHTATLLQNGKVLVLGGIDPSGATLASAELYH